MSVLDQDIKDNIKQNSCTFLFYLTQMSGKVSTVFIKTNTSEEQGVVLRCWRKMLHLSGCIKFNPMAYPGIHNFKQLKDVLKTFKI